MKKEIEGVRNVTASIVGNDVKVVTVGGNRYVIKAPTIRRIAGAVNALTNIDVGDAPTLRELLLSNRDAKAYAKALSWLVNGDECLCEELSDAPLEEVIDALVTGFDMTGQSFMKAATLLKSVRRLAARDHQ